MSGRYCVIIPAFEVAETIGALVQQVKEKGYPVIVVDDGSRDRTAAAAATAGAIVISHLKNRGKGNALQSGFSYALRSQFDGVITMDSDGQHDCGPNVLRRKQNFYAKRLCGAGKSYRCRCEAFIITNAAISILGATDCDLLEPS
ncbi:MAG: glycosyltransferase family 2 protein [Candidatus Omnitrophica bacterium]|nr:glycosyltransferase family 2 protein [Candidatus Omnitrophota bacterium]